ncbi:MAG: ATP-binding protein [Syntrophobacteraceae bacterium]
MAAWPCRAIYLYTYILFCIFLILIACSLFLKLIESNLTLEKRVRERTAELEKENSERRRTEEALRQATLVVENSPVMLFRWRAETGWPVVLVSQNVTQLGYTSEELLNGVTAFSSMVYPGDLDRVFREVTSYSLSDVDRFQQEYRVVTKDGQVRWVDDRTAIERNAEGHITHYQGIVVDITERKRVEESLRKYERMVSASQDIMALINREYVYEAVNNTFLEYLQRAREEVVERGVGELLGESLFTEHIKFQLEKAFSGERANFRTHVDFPVRGRRFMDWTYFPFLDKEGEVESVVLYARDITEARQMEEQLIQSQKLESIGTLAGGVAHEINNPINGIMNYAQLIMERMEEGSQEKEFAREIIHETGRVAKIVRNLLTFSRHEKQSHSTARLSDIVLSVLSLFQTVMRHDQIALEVSISEDLPTLMCRSQQIQQVLMNLMTNARDALNERYPDYCPDKRMRVFAEVLGKQGKRFVRTTVEDTGNGIPRQIRDRIFDPFFTTKPKESGTGLGLSISYGIVKDHCGELSVESEPGRYTRFHIDLPVDNE